MEKIKFDTEDGTVEFFIIEETRVNGINYLLVSDSDEEEESSAYLLKDTSAEQEAEAVYELVEAEDELEYVSKIFAELLDDVDIEI